MKNLSRRDFLRLSGAAVLAVGMTGALSGCDSNSSSVIASPFGKELTAGDCKVTFINLGGTASTTSGGEVYDVLLKVQNTGNATVILKTEDFKATLNDKTNVPIKKSETVTESGYLGEDTIENVIPVEAGATRYILLLLGDRVPVDEMKTLTVSVTIGKTTVAAAGTKDNTSLGFG